MNSAARLTVFLCIVYEMKNHRRNYRVNRAEFKYGASYKTVFFFLVRLDYGQPIVYHTTNITFSLNILQIGERKRQILNQLWTENNRSHSLRPICFNLGIKLIKCISKSSHGVCFAFFSLIHSRMLAACVFLWGIMPPPKKRQHKRDNSN